MLYPSWVQAQQRVVSTVQQEGVTPRVQQEGLPHRVQQVSVSRRAQQELEEKEPLQQSVLQFDSVDARFPQLAQEDAPYPVRYTFTNRGSEAVRIEQVTVSCGCRWYRYPHHLGLLRTRQQELTFRPAAGQRKLVESLVCVNSGDTPLILSADGLPPYLTFATSQPILSPSEEADLLFTLHLDLLPPEVRRQGARFEVTLQGATAPGTTAPRATASGTTAPGTPSEPRLNVIIIPFE